jgi:hypothetical protein
MNPHPEASSLVNVRNSNIFAYTSTQYIIVVNTQALAYTIHERLRRYLPTAIPRIQLPLPAPPIISAPLLPIDLGYALACIDR